MEFGWINLWGGMIVVLILVPNIIYAIKNRADNNACVSKAVTIAEQLGRYACMALMVLPVGIWKFGFRSEVKMWLYIEGNFVLIAAYYWFWRLFFKKQTKARAIALAALPTAVFLSSGILLGHWLLVAAAVLFGTAHVYITWKTN